MNDFRHSLISHNIVSKKKTKYYLAWVSNFLKYCEKDPSIMSEISSTKQSCPRLKA
jgi:hypothetical protein